LLLFAACGGGGGNSGSPTAPSALSYPGPQTFTVGVLIMPLSPSVTGTVSSYSASPALPAGVTLNATTGLISGTPTSAVANTGYTITAQNTAGSASYLLAITVNAPVQMALEPADATTIGVGQRINMFLVQHGGGAQFPEYIDPNLVTWSSSNLARAAIDANGVVAGVGEGMAVISAQYLSSTVQLSVEVSGTFTALTLPVTQQGTRRYSIYMPPTIGADPRPLMLSMHGGGGTAQLQAAMSQLVKLAQAQQIVVAFLEGTGFIQTFNAGACCGTAQTQDIDDVAYARAVIDDVEGRTTIDSSRIFATGFSNGGMMSHRLACGLADRLAGITAVGGASGELDRIGTPYYACNPTRPIPVLHIHATNDRNYPYAGGTGNGISSTDYYSVDATISDWISRNNLGSQATVVQLSPTTSCTTYTTPADSSHASAPVGLCRVDPPDLYDPTSEVVFGGGHSWPGGVRSPGQKSDVPVTDFDASNYFWNFLNP
jgi:polyhydroxybutyrate depolymerase